VTVRPAVVLVGARGLEPPNLTDVNYDARFLVWKAHGMAVGVSVRLAAKVTVMLAVCCISA